MKTTLKAIVLVSVVLLPINGHTAPLSELDRVAFVSAAYQSCLTTNIKAAPAIAGTDMLTNYCGCFASTMSKTITHEENEKVAASGVMTNEIKARVIEPAMKYCTLKYMVDPNTPASVYNKQW